MPMRPVFSLEDGSSSLSPPTESFASSSMAASTGDLASRGNFPLHFAGLQLFFGDAARLVGVGFNDGPGTVLDLTGAAGHEPERSDNCCRTLQPVSYVTP